MQPPTHRGRAPSAETLPPAEDPTAACCTPCPQTAAAQLAPLGLRLHDVPVLAAHPAVVAFIQGSLMMLGTGASLALLAARTSGTGTAAGARAGGSSRGSRQRAWGHASVMLLTSLTLWLAILD